MNTGAFGENFPYSNFHDLNTDWIIKIAKDFLDQYTHIQEVIANGEESLTNLTDTGLTQLQEKADNLEQLLQAWYDTHSSDIANQLASALSDIRNELTRAINSFATSAEQKAQDTIASIPDDYSTLATNFTKLYNAINGYIPADVIDACTRQSDTIDGLTCTWNGDTAHITGQATAATGLNFYANMSSLPMWLIPGEVYDIQIDNPYVFIEIYNYSGGNTVRILRTNKEIFWTCPNITGIIIRWRVIDTSVTLDEYITPRMVLIPSFNSQFKGSVSYELSPNANLNNITNVGWYLVDCHNVLNAPLTEGTGLLEVTGHYPTLFQRFTFTTGLSYQRYINPTTPRYDSWEAIRLLDPLYRTGIIESGDLNSLTETQYKFISAPNTIQNLPESGAGYLFVYRTTPTNIVLQEYMTFGTMHHYARQHIGTNWSDWVRISGDGGGGIVNNYNITTRPTITTDTNSWLQAIDSESTPESSATDMTGAIMSMLTDTGYCKLSEGTFYVSGNIDMPVGSMIEGCGHNTVIRLRSSVSPGYVIKPINNNSIKNLRLSGAINNPDFSNPSNRHGIAFVADRGDTNNITVLHSTIENVWIENFNGAGIYCYKSGGGIREGLLCNNVMIDYCRYGINIEYFSEYHKFNNVVTFRCDIACKNGGGNNTFSGCTFNGNTGFVIDNLHGTLTNEGHGSCVNCVFNHIGGNTGNAVEILRNSVTFEFVGCQFWYGKIVVRKSKGILFTGCSFGGNPNILCTDNTIVLISSSMFYMTPTISATPASSLKLKDCYYSPTGEEVTYP